MGFVSIFRCLNSLSRSLGKGACRGRVVKRANSLGPARCLPAEIENNGECVAGKLEQVYYVRSLSPGIIADVETCEKVS